LHSKVKSNQRIPTLIFEHFQQDHLQTYGNLRKSFRSQQ